MLDGDTLSQPYMATHLQREQLYRLFMQAPVAFCVLSGPKHMFELANPFYHQLLGADRPLIGRPLLEAVPDVAPEILTILDNVYTKGERFVGEEYPILLDWDYSGTPYVKYLNFIYEPLMATDGHVEGIMVFVYEVTDQVIARQRMTLLSEASVALTSLIDYETTLQTVARLAIPLLADYCLFDIVDDNGNLQRVAQAHIDSIDASIGELVLRHTPQLHNLTHPIIMAITTGCTQFIPFVTDAWLQQIATGPQHLELLRRLGIHSLISVPVSVREHTIGVLTFCLVTGRHNYTTAERDLAEELAYRAALAIENIRLYSAQQRARAEAERRLAELSAVIDSISDAVYIGNADGIHTCNGPALSMFGFSSVEELRRQTGFLAAHMRTRNLITGERIPPDQEGFAIALRGEPNVSEVIIRHLQTGQDRIVRCAASPIRHDGRILGAVVINTDITDRKQAEVERMHLLEREQTARAEAEGAVRVRDDFLSVAAHELKTPVTSLRGYAQLLLKQIAAHQMPNEAQMQQILQAINQQSFKLGRLIEQLLDVSRLSAGHLELQPRLVDVGTLVRDVASSMQSLTNLHKLDVQVHGDTWASVDALRVEQVLTNVIANAIKFSPLGGPISISVQRFEQASIRIDVADQGIGVPTEHQAHIFERFYQAHGSSNFGGMGLGLSISQTIIQMHGGRIEAAFPDEGGTHMTIWLPIDTASASA